MGPWCSSACKQRPADQELPGVELVLEAGPIFGHSQGLCGADVQELPRVVPLVDRLVNVYALVALQPDEGRVQDAREHLRHLRLADPGLAFQKQRAAELEGEEDGGGQALVRQVVALPEPLGELRRTRNAGGQGPPASVRCVVQRDRASSTARRVHTLARWRRKSAEAAPSEAGSVPSSAASAASATPSGEAPERASSTALALMGVEPMLVSPMRAESMEPLLSLHHGRDADDGPVLRAAAELLVSPAGVRAELRNPDLRHDLLLVQVGHQVVLEEVGGLDRPLPVRSLDDQLAFERADDARQVARGVAVGEGAADGPAMLDRGVSQEAGGEGEDAAVLLDQGVVVHVAVAGKGADGEVVALVAHVAQVVEPVQVDQDRGRGEAQPHQRDQGVPAGDELGLVAVLTEELYGVVDRFGDLVVEGHRVHYASPPSCGALASSRSTPASGEAGMSMCVTPKAPGRR